MSVDGVANEARLELREGPLVGPILSRVVGMLAARAHCPVDRLDDALLVADAIAAHAPDHTTDETLVVDIATNAETITLRVGPLPSNGAEAVIAAAELPEVGNVLERVADRVASERSGDGDAEQLVIAIAFVAPAASTRTA